MVEVTVISEKLLDGEREPQLETPEEAPQPIKSDWGHPTTNWPKNLISEPDLKPSHGLTGSVWIGNPVSKEKRRVVGFEAAKMLNEGWIKVGPRTVL